jgi:hypothetical protein
MVFLKKLCQPKPFEPSDDESKILAEFKVRKIIKDHSDGTVEVTNFGVICYASMIG